MGTTLAATEAQAFKHPAIEQAWADEVERRIAEVESGAVQLLPLADVLAEIRAALQ